MDATTKLDLPIIMPAQAQKHVTHNEALNVLDVVTQLSAESRSLVTPPETPVEGTTYLIGSNGTGEWEGREAQVACFQNGAFVYFDPKEGWRCFVRDEAALFVFSAGNWVALSGSQALPGAGRFQLVEEIIDLTGDTVSTGLIFPDRSIILGVATRTVLAITGASSYNVGFAGEPNKFGGLLNVAAGSQNIGVIGPQAIYEDSEVFVSANGGSPFTGGSVALTLHFITLGGA